MRRRVMFGAFVALALVATLVFGKQYGSRQAMGVTSGEITVVIDPGHGGFDGGAVSILGDKESQINLEISQKTYGLLAFCGVPAQILRQEDVAMAEEKAADLRRRVELVEETEHGVLLSIHQNTFPQAKYHGAQVFYSPTAGSLEWAENTQAALIAGVDPENNRQCKAGGGIFLLEQITCPGILVECGFLSNEDEANCLKDQNYQRKLALAMVDGLSRWQQEERGTDEV